MREARNSVNSEMVRIGIGSKRNRGKKAGSECGRRLDNIAATLMARQNFVTSLSGGDSATSDDTVLLQRDFRVQQKLGLVFRPRSASRFFQPKNCGQPDRLA